MSVTMSVTTAGDEKTHLLLVAVIWWCISITTSKPHPVVLYGVYFP